MTISFTFKYGLSGMKPDEVLVELYSEAVNGEPAQKIKMEVDSIGHNAAYKYHAEVTATRLANDYTVRIIPDYEGISVPLEDNLILWQP